MALVTDDNATAETNPSGSTGFNWDYVVNFRDSSAVAVDTHWILTARHVADDGGTGSFTIGGTTYTPVETVNHDPVDDPDNTDPADLALVRVDNPLPDFYDMYTGTYPTAPPQRLESLMVGYGITGTVVDQNNYNPDGSGRGTKRWGRNHIDGTIEYNGASFGTPNQGIYMDFDTEDTKNEAGAAPGDSGGGVFVEDGGTWKLAGIMTDISNSSPDANNYPDRTLAVNIQEYETWIVSSIPEPSTLALGSIALLLALGSKVISSRHTTPQGLHPPSSR